MATPQQIVASFEKSLLQFISAASDRFVYSRHFITSKLPIIPIYKSKVLVTMTTAAGTTQGITKAAARATKDVDLLDELLGKVKSPYVDSVLSILKSSDFGFVFLDRTRIHHKGLAIGEHVFSMSLAPGEEVTLTQKSFTKREVTLEDLLENEQTAELELASSMTTELEDSLEEIRKISASLSGKVGGDIQPLALLGMLMGGAGAAAAAPAAGAGAAAASGPMSVSASAEPTLQASDDVTRKQSTKQTLVHSAKSTAKYRNLHRTTFTVNTEDSLERGSQRVIKNPNRATPVDLEFYKVMRVEELSHERTGVRLCWAPWLGDPAYRIRQAQLDEIASQQSAIDTTRPQPPTPRNRKLSEPVDLSLNGKFGIYGEISIETGLSGAQWDTPEFGNALGPVQVDIPDNWEWDGSVSMTWQFPGTRKHVVTETRMAERGTRWFSPAGAPQRVVKISIRIEVDGTTSAIAAQFANSIGATHYTSSEPVFNDQAHILFRIGLTPVTTPAEQAEYDRFVTGLNTWNAEHPPIPPVEPDPAALPPFDPLASLLSQMAGFYFPRDTGNNHAAVEFWHRMFEWESASYSLYPGWWRGGPLPYPTLPATHFLNASWARLFLTVRPGYERLALRWIISRKIDAPADTWTEARFDELLNEMATYRRTNFGDPLEGPVIDANGNVTDRFITMGKWQETMPTDGTHVEAIQGITTAADDATALEISDAARLRDAVIARKTQDTAMIKKSGDLITDAPTVSVAVSATD